MLLSHGFTGSPVSIRPVGRGASASAGYGVAVPRLPGHGTDWQDLNTHRFDDWYGEVARTFDRLCLDHDAVVVGGLSMGGSLTLQAWPRTTPTGSPGWCWSTPRSSTKRLDVKLLPVLKHLVPSFPGIANDIKKEGVQEGGYTRTPLKAIHSFMQAWPTLIADLPQVTCPVLLLPLDRRPRRRRGHPPDRSWAASPRPTSPTSPSTRASTSRPSTTTPRRSSSRAPTSSPG